MNAPLRREAPCDCADCSRECPECGADLREGAQARLEAKLDAERVLLATVTAQRDALLKSARALVRRIDIVSVSHLDSEIADALRAIAAVEGDANVPF
jgi:hypothetical protein